MNNYELSHKKSPVSCQRRGKKQGLLDCISGQTKNSSYLKQFCFDKNVKVKKNRYFFRIQVSSYLYKKRGETFLHWTLSSIRK